VTGKIESFDAAKVSGSIADAAASLKNRVESKEVTALLEQGRAALATADIAMGSLNRELPRIMENLGPASENFNKTLADARVAIATFNLVGQRAATLLHEDSGTRSQLDGALASLQRLGDSLQALTELIEHNPKALLSGKKENPGVPPVPKPEGKK
jgi:multidrug resistance efflux pump